MFLLISMEIIYEDGDVLVLNKPAGLSVHQGVKTGQTLVDWLLKSRPEIKSVGEASRPGIVHRLDKNTSGVIIVAKNNRALEKLRDQFKEREVKKEYSALVHGEVIKDHGEISLPIGRSPKFRTKRVAKIVPGARPAITMFVVEKKFKNFTLLRVRPFTGRTHQIRVHLAAINHPIVGDRLYMTKPYKNVSQPDYLFLHSRRLELRLPSGVKTAFEAPIPEKFENFLRSLE